MRVKTTFLACPSSEKTIETDQDAAYFETAKGIFAIADGVSATLFSDTWSDLVVKYAVENPLFSKDLFEVQWWLEGVQPRYEAATPKAEELPYHAQDKARAGSLCTLTVLRITKTTTDTAQAQLLGFGDSVIMIQRKNGEIESFPIKVCEDFGLAPICIPAKMVSFDRSFNRCETLDISLRAGETVLLATDAVAAWILCAPQRGQSIAEAFQIIAAQTQETWKSFIESRRPSREIVDDDSTALILNLDIDARQGNGWDELGKTPMPDLKTMQTRRAQLQEALKKKQWERVAVLWGDGIQIQTASGTNPTEKEIEYARNVADASAAVSAAIRRGNKQDTETARNKLIGDAWNAHRVILDSEPSVRTLRENLLRGGMITDAPPQIIPTPPPPPPKRIVPDVPTPDVPVQPPEPDDPRKKQSEVARQELADAIQQDDEAKILAVKKKYEGPIISQILEKDPEWGARVDLAENRTKVMAAIESGEEIKIEQAAQGLSLAKFPTETRERIERARELAPKIQELKEALEPLNEKKVASLYKENRSEFETLLKCKDFESADKRQIYKIIEDQEWVERLERALTKSDHENGNEQEISQIFREIPSRLNILEKLTLEQRQQVELARRCVEMPEQVRNALENYDDTKLLESYDEALVRSFTNFSNQEKDRIAQAKSRKVVAERILDALEDSDADGREKRIINLKAEFHGLKDSNLLTTAHRNQIEQIFERNGKINDLAQAIALGDEKQIVERFQRLESDERLPTKLRERGELAEARVRAAQSFGLAVRNVSPMTLAQAGEIVKSYDAELLDGSPLISQEQREHLEHARYLLEMEKLRQDEWEIVRLIKERKVKWEQLDSQQREQIQDTLRRSIAELQLRRAVLENDPNVLTRNYDPILEELADTPEEKELLKQANKTRNTIRYRISIRFSR